MSQKHYLELSVLATWKVSIDELDKLFNDNKILSQSISNQTKTIQVLSNSTATDVKILEKHSQENISQINEIINGTNRNTQSIAVSNQ